MDTYDICECGHDRNRHDAKVGCISVLDGRYCMCAGFVGRPSPETAPPEDKGSSALDTQVGGDHYKSLSIQPMEYSMANGLDACQHTIIKYVTRFRSKGGLEDLEKARHALEMLIQFERSKA